jgi:integrase
MSKDRVKGQPGVYKYRKKDGDTVFYIRYKVGRKQKEEKVGSRKEGVTAKYAVQVRGERLRQIRHGDAKPLEAKRVTLGEAFETYIMQRRAQGLVVKADESRYDRYWRSKFGARPLTSILPMDISKEMGTWTHLKPSTIGYVLGLLSRIYNSAIANDQFYGINPLRKVKRPKVSNQRTRYLTHKEAHYLFNVIPYCSELYLQVKLSIFTGLRKKELMDLQGVHLDLEHKIVHVVKSNEVTTKGTTRHVPLPDDLVTELRDWPMEPYKPVFTHNPRKRFNTIVKRLGLNDGVNDPRHKVVWHTLRHTFASWLAIQGVPLYKIAKLMGHSTIAHTQRYAKLCPDGDGDLVNKMSAVFQLEAHNR